MDRFVVESYEANGKIVKAEPIDIPHVVNKSDIRGGYGNVYSKKDVLQDRILHLESEIKTVEGDVLVVTSQESVYALNRKIKEMKQTLFGLKIEWNRFYK